MVPIVKYLIPFFLLLAGCIQQPQSRPEVVRKPEPIKKPELVAEVGSEIAVKAPVAAWQFLAMAFPDNTFVSKQPIELGVVSIPAGQEVTARFKKGAAFGEITFSSPYPSAKKLGVSVAVKSVKVYPDGSGVAKVAKSTAFGDLPLPDYEFAWTQKTGVAKAPATADIKIWVFTAEWCGPCPRFVNNVLKPVCEEAGLEVGETEDSAVRLVDVDRHPELWSHYSQKNNLVPQVVVFKKNAAGEYKPVGDGLVHPDKVTLLKKLAEAANDGGTP